MTSIDKALDELADLYLTAPIPGHRRRPQYEDGHGLDVATRRVLPIRIAPPRLVDAQDEPKSDCDRLKFVNIANESLRDPLELAANRSIDGPFPLAVRYTRDRWIRMAVDRHGRVHLWRTLIDQDIQTGVVSLITARFWVRENVELISLTEPSRLFDLEAEPMLHLFMSDATKAKTLDGALGPYLKVHHQPIPQGTDSNLTARERYAPA
jgi:hypothetical protein